MDRYTKTILTGIFIALISIAAKDVELFQIAEAQQGWELDNDLAMNGAMQALATYSGYGYICRSYLVNNNQLGINGGVATHFHSEPQCMGEYLGLAYFYSEGAMASSEGEPSFLFDQDELLYYANSLARAAENGQRVRYVRCSFNLKSCLRFVEFRGDPRDVDDAD